MSTHNRAQTSVLQSDNFQRLCAGEGVEKEREQLLQRAASEQQCERIGRMIEDQSRLGDALGIRGEVCEHRLRLPSLVSIRRAVLCLRQLLQLRQLLRHIRRELLTAGSCGYLLLLLRLLRMLLRRTLHGDVTWRL